MIAHRAQKIAQILAKNDTFGYDQVDRWSGLHAYKAQDGRAGDFDCSSLVISCYILAGLELPAKGYSGDIVKRFTATGKFRAHYDDAHLTTDKLATAGGVYVAEKSTFALLSTKRTPRQKNRRQTPKLSILRVISALERRRSAVKPSAFFAKERRKRFTAQMTRRVGIKS